MNNAFIRDIFISNPASNDLRQSEIDKLSPYFDAANKRISVFNFIIGNVSSIVANAARALFAEQPQLIAPGGNAYTTRRMASCLRDMEIILRYVACALYCGNASVLDDLCLNGLRETYLALGIPISSVAIAIKKMKEVTSRIFIASSQKEQNKFRELTISDIRILYPKQWVTIKVTKYEDGLPSSGKVVYHSHDIRELANNISQFTGNNISSFA